MADKPVRLDIMPSVALRRAVDRWRVEQSDAPSRAEAARRLIEIGLEADPLSARITALCHYIDASDQGYGVPDEIREIMRANGYPNY